jgi:hypothetical protein
VVRIEHKRCALPALQEGGGQSGYHGIITRRLPHRIYPYGLVKRSEKVHPNS